MRRIILLIALIALMPMTMGIGVKLWPGGGSSGPTNPTDPAADSEICIGDNASHGNNRRFCLRVDNDTGFIQDIDDYLGRAGLPGLLRTSVNVHQNTAGAHALVSEHFGWHTGTLSGGTAAAAYSTLGANQYQIRSTQGCAIRPVALSVTLTNSNAVADEYECDFYAQTSVAAANHSYDNRVAGAVDTANWTLCNEHIEIGPGSDNTTWGYGDSSSGVAGDLDTFGDWHVVPLSGCTGGAPNTTAIVRIDDRSADSCDKLNGATVTLWTLEDCS